MRTSAAARRGARPEAQTLRGREAGEVGALGRQHEPGMRAAGAEDDPALDAARLAERDELPGERLDERMQAGAGPRRAQAARARDRRGQQRIALGQREEGRDVVVDAEQEAQPVERRGGIRRVERDPQRPVAALRDARVGGPGRRRERRAPRRRRAGGGCRRARLPASCAGRRGRAGAARSRRHGISPAAAGGASAKPGATSSSVAMRARRSRRRSS